MLVTTRYYAAASAAAGVDAETIEVADGSTARDLLARCRERHPGFGSALDRCSLLRDGLALRPETQLAEGDTVDLVPPFAGG
jgi:molybdopterin converting factor small subunit